MKKVKLNAMEMFQIVNIRPGTTMEKVPGGWIHCQGYEGEFCNTFIPNSKEIGNEEYEVIN